MPEEHELSDRRCSLDQVMFGLCQVYEDSWRPNKEPLTLETPLRNLVSLDVDELVYDLDDVFDVLVPFDPIVELLRRDATVGEFAEFLRGILPRVNLAPMQIAGTSCDKAAAFLAIQAILQHYKLKHRLTPSQRIQDVLSCKQIDQLWYGLHWVLQGQSVPRESWDAYRAIHATSCWQGAGLTLSVGLVFALGGLRDLLLLFGPVALLWACAGIALRVGMSPLPNGVETFRDLATLIVRQRQARSVA